MQRKHLIVTYSMRDKNQVAFVMYHVRKYSTHVTAKGNAQRDAITTMFHNGDGILKHTCLDQM